MNKIKIITRENMLETNSSSTHSLVIYMGGELVKPGDPDFDLDIRKNILYVPKTLNDFGWEWNKSNSCLIKLQYVAGLICPSLDNGVDHKKVNKLKHILMSYLGVKDVVFEWDSEFFKKLRSGRKPEDIFRDIPIIDHQSISDSYEEITESKETLIRFIFSRNSWWYGGNDNSAEPENFYKEVQARETNPVATLSIDFGGSEVGRLDIQTTKFPCDIYELLGNDDVLQRIFWNNKTKKIEFNSLDGYRDLGKWRNIDSDLFAFISDVAPIKSGKPYVVFGGGTHWTEERSKLMDKEKELYNPLTINQELYDRGLLEEGRDYVMFPIVIKSTEFGDVS